LQYRMPADSGYLTNASSTASGTIVTGTNYSYSNTAPLYLNWYKVAYVGNRGSIKWLYNSPNVNSTTQMNTNEVYRVADPAKFNYSNGTIATAIPNSVAGAITYQGLRRPNPGGSGSLIVNEKAGAGLTFEHSFFNYLRFSSNKPTAVGTINDGTFYDSHAYTMKFYQPSTYVTHVDRYASIGTDFTLLMFLCVPPCSIITTQPTIATGPVTTVN